MLTLPELALYHLRSALDGSGRSLARCYWLQLHCVSEPLIPGPLDHPVLFGSSSLVPKQLAVTSTGAYVLMDLGSVRSCGAYSRENSNYTLLVLSFVWGTPNLCPRIYS